MVKLDLAGSHVTSKGLRELRAMKQLEDIYLEGVSVESLEPFRECRD